MFTKQLGYFISINLQIVEFWNWLCLVSNCLVIVYCISHCSHNHVPCIHGWQPPWRSNSFVLFIYHLWGNSVREKYLTSLQCTQQKARSEMKILKNKNMIMLFLGRAMAYFEGWNVIMMVTDLKGKDMVLCSDLGCSTPHGC